MGNHTGARLAVAVMAKAPIAGEAKTRLGAEIGHAGAAAIYRAFLLDTLDVLAAVASTLNLTAKLLVSPDRRHADQLRRIVGDAWPVLTQTRDGLMGGIADAFEHGFASGADIVVVTDADSPLALWQSLADCVAVAVDHDLGLGPTADGGYYLITAKVVARRVLADLLLGATFDGATICSATGARARALGLSVGLGPVGFDVDVRSDLLELAARLDDLPVGPLTRTHEAVARVIRRDASSSGTFMGRSHPFRPTTAQSPLPLGEG